MKPENFNTLDEMLRNGSAAKTAQQAADAIAAMQKPIQAPPMPIPGSPKQQTEPWKTIISSKESSSSE